MNIHIKHIVIALALTGLISSPIVMLGQGGDRPIGPTSPTNPTDRYDQAWV